MLGWAPPGIGVAQGKCVSRADVYMYQSEANTRKWAKEGKNKTEVFMLVGTQCAIQQEPKYPWHGHLKPVDIWRVPRLLPTSSS